MNAQHTPTPWFAVNDGTEDEPMMMVKAARIAGHPPQHEVAILATGDSSQEMENANAAFIVRACNSFDDLVAALESLLPGLILDLRYAGQDDDVDALKSRVDTVTAALAKAGAA